MSRWGSLVIWFMLVVLLAGPVVESAHAAMDDQMTGMFNSWGLLSATSPPGAFQGQTRNAYTGGSLEMRFQNQQLQLFSISPPRLSVGCGGIDAYLGGFSYGSLSRYVQMLQQMGTGAVLGYAFQLALKPLCPDCSDVLNKLEAAARAMNTLGRINPCNAAASIQAAMKAGEALSAVGTSVSKAWDTSLINRGLINDPIDGQDVRANQTSAQANADMTAAGTPMSGNLVWTALMTSATPPSTGVAHLMMSLFGTIVVDANAIPNYHPPTLEYKDIMQTRTGDTPNIITCLDNENPDGCLAVLEGPSTGDMSGFEEQVETSLNSLATSAMMGVTPSIADQQTVNASTVPVWRMLLDYGKNAADRDMIVRYSSNIIATDMSFYYISYVRREVVKQVLNYKKVNPSFIGDADQFLQRMDETYRTLVEEVKTRNSGLEAARQTLAYFFQRPAPRPIRK